MQSLLHLLGALLPAVGVLPLALDARELSAGLQRTVVDGVQCRRRLGVRRPVNEEPDPRALGPVVRQEALGVRARSKRLEASGDARIVLRQKGPVAEMALEELLRDDPPERIVDDAVDVALLPAGRIQHLQRALDDLGIAERMRVREERNGEVARPRQTVALDAVQQELAHAETKRAERGVVYRLLARRLAREAELVRDVGDLLGKGDLRRLLARKAEVAERERTFVAPDALADFLHLRRLFEVLDLVVQRLGGRLADKELRHHDAFRLDVADRLLPEVVEILDAHERHRAPHVLLHTLRDDGVRHLEELPRIPDLHLQRLHVAAHVPQDGRLVLRLQIDARRTHTLQGDQSSRCQQHAFTLHGGIIAKSLHKKNRAGLVGADAPDVYAAVVHFSFLVQLTRANVFWYTMSHLHRWDTQAVNEGRL